MAPKAPTIALHGNADTPIEVTVATGSIHASVTISWGETELSFSLIDASLLDASSHDLGDQIMLAMRDAVRVDETPLAA